MPVALALAFTGGPIILTVQMTTQLVVPEHVRLVLDSLVESARSSFGSSLRSVMLYGSAAEGKLRATSDINLMFVLDDFTREQTDSFRQSYRNAQAAVRVTAMFVRASELAEAAEAFAQKFTDLQRRHVVLYGDDVTAHLTISREAKIRRLRQSLLNYTMRTREAYIGRSLREEQAARLVADAAGPLRSAAALLLELEGRAETTDGRAALLLLASELGGEAAVPAVERISTAREETLLEPGTSEPTLFEILRLAESMHERAAKIR